MIIYQDSASGPTHFYFNFWHELTLQIVIWSSFDDQKTELQNTMAAINPNDSLRQSKLTLPSVIANPMAAVGYKLLYTECFHLLSQFRLLSVFWIFG